MNNTLIENLNALMTVKKELNKVLVDNEQPGGPVFDTYPEQFRELFRVLEDKLDDIEEGPYATYEPETVVAKPIIGFENNVVTLTCPTQGADIYFKTKDIYGNEIGWGPYTTRFSISRDTYIETYAILNGVRSSQPDNSRWCYYQAGGAVPAPEFDRTNGIVTITCMETNAQIWWRIMPSTTFVLYTGPELVDGTKWLEAYAVYQGKGSETAISEGTEEGITVEDPVLTCTDNVVTITCATEDAVIWYKTNLDGEWTVYTEPIEISVDTEFTAYAYKEGNISNTVTESFEYEEPYVPPVVVPADPQFSILNNVVTITCSTSGATIYYSRDNGVTYNVYSTGIPISEDTDFLAYAELNGETSNTISYSAEYIDPDIPVVPQFSTYDDFNMANYLKITCPTMDAIIYYSYDNITYNTNNQPEINLYISYNDIVYAYCYRNGFTSAIVSYSILRPEQVTFNVNNNIVTINCTTPNVSIYYQTMIRNSNIWGEYTLYTNGISITEDVRIRAYSFLNGFKSSGNSLNAYLPTKPTIVCKDNIVIIKSDYTIYYSTDDINYNQYTYGNNGFSINANTTVYAYTLDNGLKSDIIQKTCYYIADITTEEINTYLTFEVIESGTISWCVDLHNVLDGAIPGPGDAIRYPILNSDNLKTIYYSVNDGSWLSLTPVKTSDYHGEVTIQVNSGDVIKWRGIDNYYGTDIGNSYNCHIKTNTKVYVYGNLLSVTKDFMVPLSISYDASFKISNFLRDNTKMYNHPIYDIVIPSTMSKWSVGMSTSIHDGNYGKFDRVFKGCTNLTRTPKIDTKNYVKDGTIYSRIIEYEYTFEGCTNLITAIFDIYANKIDLLDSTFKNCINLTRPPIIFSEIIREGNKETFYNCSSLNQLEIYTTKKQSNYDESISNIGSINSVFNNTDTYTGNCFYNLPQNGTIYLNTNMIGGPDNWTIVNVSI